MLNKHFAYGADHHAIETVMRLHSVKRWHMIDTTRTQTLAEHSANTALLAYLIAMSSPMHFFGDPMLIAVATLVHDIPEAFTGDIPTHTKPHIEGMDALERTVTHPMFNVLMADPAKTLIKLCDLADGIRFIRLHGVDVTARHAREGLEEQLMIKFDGTEWPDEVQAVVRKNIMFYAYENH